MAHVACSSLIVTPHVFEALRHAGVPDPACMTRFQILWAVKVVLELDLVKKQRDDFKRGYHRVRCPQCDNYFPGHATGADDVCNCPDTRECP